MWQRQQTLYLGIACALIFSMFFGTMATILGPDGQTETIRYSEKLLYLLLTIMVFTGNMICLLTYKFRMLQMRVAVLVGLMLLGYQVLLAIAFFQNHNDMVFSFSAVFPIVASILDFIAARCILMDEAVVRSASRLRKARK